MNQGKNLVYLIIAVIYFLSPIDFVPDFIPLVGWLDDIVVFLKALEKCN